jgi:copper chaperone
MKNVIMERTIEVENIKCTGCASSIVKKLNSIEEVSNVEVDVEKGTVTLLADDNEEIWDKVKAELRSMGYTEKGEGNFIDKTKSYVSCAIGKMST